MFKQDEMKKADDVFYGDWSHPEMASILSTSVWNRSCLTQVEPRRGSRVLDFLPEACPACCDNLFAV